MLVAFQHAIGSSEENERASVIEECQSEVNQVVVALYNLARENLLEFVSLQDSWASYLNQIDVLLCALESALQWNERDHTTLENIIYLCKDNIEGVSYRDEFDNNRSKTWLLSPEYEQIVRSRMMKATEMIRSIDPNFIPPKAEAPKSGCFVVTATMGDEQHPSVVLMRRFRDDWLLERRWGKAVISFYYNLGPSFADVIKKSKILRFIAYTLIVVPMTKVAKTILENKRN